MKREYVICIRGDNEPELSIETGKIYRTLPDEVGEKHGLTRVIDETGEDYLYPFDCFIPIELPEEAERALYAVAPLD